MPVRGVKPKPTAIKIAQGNPGQRPLPENEPEIEPGLPPCPPHLGKEAAKEWAEMGAQLEKEGRIGLAYKANFAVYCESWGRWVEAVERVNAEGAVVETVQGGGKRSPWIVVANDASAQLMRAAVELGLTPSSQARVQTVKKTQKGAEKDPRAAYMRALA